MKKRKRLQLLRFSCAHKSDCFNSKRFKSDWLTWVALAAFNNQFVLDCGHALNAFSDDGSTVASSR